MTRNLEIPSMARSEQQVGGSLIDFQAMSRDRWPTIDGTTGNTVPSDEKPLLVWLTWWFCWSKWRRRWRRTSWRGQRLWTPEQWPRTPSWKRAPSTTGRNVLLVDDARARTLTSLTPLFRDRVLVESSLIALLVPPPFKTDSNLNEAPWTTVCDLAQRSYHPLTHLS